MKPVELSYAQLAAAHIREDEEKCLLELDHYLREEESDGFALKDALKDWQETLSLFVHVFPKEGRDDLYKELLESTNLGLFLMEEARRGTHQLEWARAAFNGLTAHETQTYLDTLNTQYATGRKIQEMPRAYWFGVNFIPDLSASFSSNFKDYLKAQKKALAADVLKASDGDPLFPGQNLLLQNVRDRSEVLLRLEEKYLPVEESFSSKAEIAEIHRSYAALLDQINRYTLYRDAKDEAKASVLGKQIRKDWELEKQRARSSAKG